MRFGTRANRRFIISKNLILMLVMVLVSIMAIWSWFTVNKTVDANSICVKSVYGNEVYLAYALKTDSEGNVYENQDSFQAKTSPYDGPGAFGDELNFTIDEPFAKDCTGDGETLIVPSFSNAKDKATANKTGKIVNSNGAWTEALSNIDLLKLRNDDANTAEKMHYYEINFYSRSDTKTATLNADSNLLSKTEVDGFRLSQSEYTKDTVSHLNTSAYGPFNHDALVGAVRVSIMTEGCINDTFTYDWNSGKVVKTKFNFGNRQKQLLWVPRPDLFLNVPDDGSITGWSLMRDITNTSSESYTNNYLLPSAAATGTTTYKSTADSTQTILAKNAGTGVSVVDSNDNNTVFSTGALETLGYSTLGSSVVVSNFTGKIGENNYNDVLTPCQIRISEEDHGSGKYYIFRYTMRIWIEGTDAEARRAMDEGKFQLNLKFE